LLCAERNAANPRRRRYLLGVHNPATNTLTLHSAPLHSISPSVKSLKGLPSSSSAAQLISTQRAALGATFGTKKAIRHLNAQARNKLDDTSYGTGLASSSLQSHLQSSITASSLTLPTSLAIEHAANVSRPTIPPPNFDAKSPAEVYDLTTVVTVSELSTIDLGPFLAAANLKEVNQLLPYRRSKFIADRLRKLLPSRSSVETPIANPSKKDRERIKLLIHLSHLFAFRQATAGGKDSALERGKMQEKLGSGASPIVVDALLERYTEVQRMGNGEEKRKTTGGTELKLLGYLLVVVLKVDGWSTDVGVVASDLGIGDKKWVLLPLVFEAVRFADPHVSHQGWRALPLARLPPRRSQHCRAREARRHRCRLLVRRSAQEQAGCAQGPVGVPSRASRDSQALRPWRRLELQHRRRFMAVQSSVVLPLMWKSPIPTCSLRTFTQEAGTEYSNAMVTGKTEKIHSSIKDPNDTVPALRSSKLGRRLPRDGRDDESRRCRHRVEHFSVRRCRVLKAIVGHVDRKVVLGDDSVSLVVETCEARNDVPCWAACS
jgi:hypothetical protein